MRGAYEHAALVAEMAALLWPWAREGARGRVGVGWAFHTDGSTTTPDVTLEWCAPEAHTVAVEVLAAHDRRADVDERVRFYLRAGAAAVAVVDPATETFAIHERTGSRVWRAGQAVTHALLPCIDVATLFESARS